MSRTKINLTFMFFLFFLASCGGGGSNGDSGSAGESVVLQGAFDIGNPEVDDVYVDPLGGNDANSGNIPSAPLRSVKAVWAKIPIDEQLSRGVKVHLAPGDYPSEDLPNYWERRFGTYQAPIIFEASAAGVVFRGSINMFRVEHFYLIGVTIRSGGDAFHCELCDTVLLRNVELDGGEAWETLKVNQSQHFYVEGSTIYGAQDNAIDFVAVQYGHIIGNRVSNAADWCAYVKGGSAYITVRDNEIFNCQTGGFTAGQGTGFEFMVDPWLTYEAYDVKVFNNVIHDIYGAGLGVNGGANVLLAHNTLYRIGARSHLIDIGLGERGCDGNIERCGAHLQKGGWGTAGPRGLKEPVPNYNVYVLNNLVVNPEGASSKWGVFAIAKPGVPATSSNITSPARADEGLVIAGNVIWNGGVDLPLGIGEGTCVTGSCTPEFLEQNNRINRELPQFRNPDAGDFSLLSGNVDGVKISAFPGRAPGMRGPTGALDNSISTDRAGVTRSLTAGAYSY